MMMNINILTSKTGAFRNWLYFPFLLLVSHCFLISFQVKPFECITSLRFDSITLLYSGQLNILNEWTNNQSDSSGLNCESKLSTEKNRLKWGYQYFVAYMDYISSFCTRGLSRHNLYCTLLFFVELIRCIVFCFLSLLICVLFFRFHFFSILNSFHCFNRCTI